MYDVTVCIDYIGVDCVTATLGHPLRNHRRAVGGQCCRPRDANWQQHKLLVEKITSRHWSLMVN